MSLRAVTLSEGRTVSRDFDGSFDRECDICVIGLGTAGAISAIAAAKRGVRVIGVDLSPIPGGVGTSACVWDYYYGASGGLYKQINSTANEIAGSGHYLNSTKPGYKRSYITPVKSLALERNFANYGVECHYRAFVTEVILDGDRVCGAIIFNGEQSIRIGAKVIIDGAEGAVCRLLGLKELGGRRSDNKSARFSRTVGVMYNGMLLGRWCFCEDYAGTTPEEAARMTFKWATEPPCLVGRFDERNRLYATGCEMGRREVPCIETEQVYTFEDYLAGVRYDNAVFYSFSPLDNANPDIWNEDEDFQDWQLLCGMHAYGVSVGIPPECLIPKGMGGLVLAGKHIGTGHTMTSTVRMRTDIEKCGEAAGVLAAMMTERGESALTIAREHFEELAAALTESGCLDKSNDRGVCDLNVPDGEMWQSCRLPEKYDELRQTLASIHPSLGLYAVRIAKDKRAGLADTLAGWLGSDKLLRENSAVALGLLGDRRAARVLRDILRGECEVYVYESPAKYHFGWLYTTELCNYIKAACLLGRVGDESDLELLGSVAAYDGDDQRRRKAAEYAKASLLKLKK